MPNPAKISQTRCCKICLTKCCTLYPIFFCLWIYKTLFARFPDYLFVMAWRPWRMDRRHPSFAPCKMYVNINYFIANEMKLLRIKYFINIRSQGKNSCDDGSLAEYHRSVSQSHQTGDACRYARIWHLREYMSKYRILIPEHGPFKTSILS